MATLAASSVEAEKEPLDRRAPLAGGFNHLVGDLLVLVCESLPVHDLLALRRVSRHWAATSRLARSWSHSSWSARVGRGDFEYHWERISHLCDTAPHLRDLTLPVLGCDASRRAGLTWDSVGQLHELERLVFLYDQPNVRLVESLPNLQHIQTVGAGQNYEYDVPVELEAVCAKSGLVTLRGVGDNAGSALDALSNSASAAVSLLALELRVYESFRTVDRFLVLEELSLELVNPFEQGSSLFISSLRALGSAPALRLLTIDAVSDDVCLDDAEVHALLSPKLAERLEHLLLTGCSFSRASMRRIISECTSLLSLGIHCHFNACYRPLTKEEQTILQSEPDIEPDVMRVLAAEAAGGQPDTRPRDLYPDFLDLGLFLNGPRAFRQRLLALQLSCNNREQYPHALTQCIEAFPLLGHLAINQFQPSDVPGTLESASQLKLATLTPADHDNARHSPFRFVRALKLAAGLPLALTEINPSRFR